MESASLHPRRGRFLHLVTDEKFIDAAHGIFEEASPGNHDFLLIGRPPLRLIRTFQPICMDIDVVLRSDTLSALPKYSAVFIHYLSDAARCVVASSSKETKFVWLGWGADFYHLIQPQDTLILPKTQALYARRSTIGTKLYEACRRLWRWRRSLVSPAKMMSLARLNRILNRLGRNKPAEHDLVNRFYAIATPIREDYEAILLRNPGLGASYLDWNYWTDGIDGCKSPSLRDEDESCVLLGNSATPENNHLEALDILSTCLPDDWRIYCPLSYGSKAYGDAVERYGTALLGTRFIALREYMPSESYRRIVASCSVVIMNHIRQQALGNILLALCDGSHLVLNSRSPIRNALRRIGIDVNTIDQLPGSFSERTIRIRDEATIASTREKIEAHYGRPSILQRTREILSELQ